MTLIFTKVTKLLKIRFHDQCIVKLSHKKNINAQHNLLIHKLTIFIKNLKILQLKMIFQKWILKINFIKIT